MAASAETRPPKRAAEAGVATKGSRGSSPETGKESDHMPFQVVVHDVMVAGKSSTSVVVVVGNVVVVEDVAVTGVLVVVAASSLPDPPQAARIRQQSASVMPPFIAGLADLERET